MELTNHASCAVAKSKGICGSEGFVATTLSSFVFLGMCVPVCFDQKRMATSQSFALIITLHSDVLKEVEDHHTLHHRSKIWVCPGSGKVKAGHASCITWRGSAACATFVYFQTNYLIHNILTPPEHNMVLQHFPYPCSSGFVRRPLTFDEHLPPPLVQAFHIRKNKLAILTKALMNKSILHISFILVG